LANPRSFKKKNRLDRVLINSLIVAGIVVLLSGPIRELYVLTLKMFASMNKSISTKTNFQVNKILNSSEVIQQQSAQIDTLTAQLADSERKLKTATITAQRVEITDALLKLKRSEFPKSVAASIIARSPSSWHQELIIDKGSSNGIKLGMVAVTDQGILGQVQEAKKNYSIIQLVSSSQIRFGAMVHRSGVIGILFGSKAGYAQLKFVPIGSDVQKGDIIQTTAISPSGVERLFPVSYPVGKVIEVNKDESNSEMLIKVKLFEDGSKLSDVLVLLPAGNKASAWHLNPARLETLLSQKIKQEAESKASIEGSVSQITSAPVQVTGTKPAENTSAPTAAKTVSTKPTTASIKLRTEIPSVSKKELKAKPTQSDVPVAPPVTVKPASNIQAKPNQPPAKRLSDIPVINEPPTGEHNE
jgi:rod shape-determining protein MreC